ncbi:hypothetical protein LINGRAHAP2_LOCUS34199 [Linum grandiflorum]
MENTQLISKHKLEFLDILKSSWNMTSQNPLFIFLSLLTSFPAFLFFLWQQPLLQQLFHGAADLASDPELAFSPWKVGLIGPYITSVCNLGLVLLVMAGLASLGVQMFGLPFNGWVSKVLFGSIFVALLAKYVGWRAIWNVGLVVSILEGKHGYIGIGVAGYISRGCRKRGFLLMLVFLVWRVVLKVGFWYYWFCLESYSSGYKVVLSVVGEGGLAWFGEVMNWVVCTVYYYDCRRRFLDKKVDLERQRGAADRVTL